MWGCKGRDMQVYWKAKETIMKRWTLVLALVAAAAAPSAARGDAVDDFVESLKSGAKTPYELAAVILDAAGSAKDNPDLQLKLCAKAYEHGIKHPKGLPTAIAALRKLIAGRPEQKRQWHRKLLDVYARSLRAMRGEKRKAIGQALATGLVEAGDAEMTAGTATEAAKLYLRAIPVAGYGGAGFKETVVQKLKAARDREKIEKQLATLIERLKAKPDDAAARQRAINIYVVELDNPTAAKALLTEEIDERWRTYVPLAMEKVADLPAAVCIELAEWYRSLARTTRGRAKLAMLTRAQKYCERYIAKQPAEDTSVARAKLLLGAIKVEAESTATALHGGGARDRITFVAGKSMKLYPVGQKFMSFPVQKTQDARGPFVGQGVYFNQKTGKDVVYEIRSARLVHEVHWRGAAMSNMTMEIISGSGKVVARTGPHGGGNVWGTFRVKVPASTGRYFFLRLHNTVSTWYYVQAIKLVR